MFKVGEYFLKLFPNNLNINFMLIDLKRSLDHKYAPTLNINLKQKPKPSLIFLPTIKLIPYFRH